MEKELKTAYLPPEITFIFFDDESVVKTSGITTGKQEIIIGDGTSNDILD